MGWNTGRTTKVLTGSTQQTKDAKVPLGAPIATNPGLVGRGYSDGWDIERAYREAMQKVTWVARAVEVIAGNQARLNMVLRKDNAPDGEIISSKNDLLTVLNSKSNIGENSYVFRHRMSSQLLLSSRGVFVEKVRSRDGRINALHLLPPQHTRPIPHPKTFVSGYEVTVPGQGFLYLKPEDVIWIRRPHPLDPYLSMTPLESVGVAVEIENLAKLYNRNFLLNDGRPGGLLVVRGEMDDDDKEELRSRFRGNLNRAGATTVIAADDGVDFVDTSANMRDAAYVQMRQLTKEEILAGFGVPESAIGNASGRTFANASEELRVFWMETMMPHLAMLARPLDELDEKYFIDFDTSSVPILIIAKQERERYLMEEYQSGLISANEYRSGSGRRKVKSELADSLLANPNLTPIANTEKEFKPEEQARVDAPVDPNATTDPNAAPVDPNATPAPSPFAEVPGEPVPEGQSSASTGGIEVKSAANDDWETKAEQIADRWTSILSMSLERFFERQHRVVTEKAFGAKARKALSTGTLSTEMIFDTEVWDRQMRDDLRPVLAGIALEGAATVDEVTGQKSDLATPEVETYLDDQMDRLTQMNQTTKAEIQAAVLAAVASGRDDDSSALLKVALAAIFAALLAKRLTSASEHEAQTAFNFGVYHAAQTAPTVVTKTWKTRQDPRVRSAHVYLEGKTVPIGSSFAVDGSILRFPGDPTAPPALTMGCRCRLSIRRNTAT